MLTEADLRLRLLSKDPRVHAFDGLQPISVLYSCGIIREHEFGVRLDAKFHIHSFFWLHSQFLNEIKINPLVVV